MVKNFQICQKLNLYEGLFIDYVRENREGGGSKNIANCLTLLSNFPYVGGGRGAQKSQKLPYVINGRPLRRQSIGGNLVFEILYPIQT